ncbi:MAG: DEAD/DEAH box helicase family protein [Candidatus Methanomethyliaceae archaeon]|nr:DEAD/DEAH box helicase family protein [Candidatus Methanomethyliaceae archaeon]MDW7971492.1 DEAD/DEAH box helicase family protein [Nitrososphaerota archaeon]
MSEFDIADVLKKVNEALAKLEEFKRSIEVLQAQIRSDFERKIELFRFSQVKKEFLEAFFEEPYLIIPKRANEWYVIAPKWLNFSIGWLERSTKSYNIFVVNRYVKWFSEIPPSLKEKFKFAEPMPFKVFNGILLTGKELREEAMRRYKHFITRCEGEDRLRIKKGYEFKLIAQMIEDGTLPFMPIPVREEDLRPWDGIKLRSYQQHAWNEFLNKGAIGVFWPFGSGKSLFGIYVLARVKGRKLVVVPTLTLKEQWLERINKYIPKYGHEIEVVTYHAYDKVKNNEYVLIIFDECQHLPANTFVRLATLRTKYRMGFSGSPYREDGRENYIIALTGFPIGMSWEELIRLQVVREPTFRVYILSDNREKMRKLSELLLTPVKTLIFCDWLNLGEKIAKTFNIPFIYGETKDRLDIIRGSQVCVVSRVGDEGLSLPGIERVIEVAFLHGSRMQESQRFGRLMHSTKEEPEHIILMTEEEFEKYQKRLYPIIERGFRIEFIR